MEIYISVALLVALFLYLYMIFPAVRRHGDRVLMDGMYIAHRGIHNNEHGLPENSRVAVLLTLKLGFAIEADLRLTADGKVVIFHDDTLKRLCGVEGSVETKTWDELRSLRLLGTEQAILTLEELLSLVDGKVPLLLELKSYPNNNKALCKAADECLSEYNGKYMVQSFYPPALLWYRRHRKYICRGQLADCYRGEGMIKTLSGWLMFNFISRPDFVSYNYHYTQNFSRNACTALGAFPVGWTFRSEQGLANVKSQYRAYIFEDILPDQPYDE